MLGVGLGSSRLTGLGGEMAMGFKDVFGRFTCDLVTTVSSDTKTSLCARCRFSTGWNWGCVRIRSLYFMHVYLCGDG